MTRYFTPEGEVEVAIEETDYGWLSRVIIYSGDRQYAYTHHVIGPKHEPLGKSDALEAVYKSEDLGYINSSIIRQAILLSKL
ncbi:MAG: hypothetical protein HY619_04475 [Thaumarchaeota archaeon]|nr:hypothetical protein [Nitrososphaerota archaeon]